MTLPKKVKIACVVFLIISIGARVTFLLLDVGSVYRFEFISPIRITKREETKIIYTDKTDKIMEELTKNDIELKICSTFGVENCRMAVAVMMGESGGNPLAVNINTGSVDIGLFQINSVHYTKDICSLDKIVSVEGNISCAYSIFKTQGWSPWVAYTNSSYLKHMKVGEKID